MSMMNTLKILLRPAATFALRRGLKLQDVVEALRAVLVEVASDELKKSGGKSSTSRIAVMTGLQRRVVAEALSSPDKEARASSVLTKVIGQWRSDSRYSKGGEPKTLTCEGTQSEFFQMVQLVTRDISPYAVCFELERIGAVRRVGDRLELLSRAYDARNDPQNGWRIWSSDAETLMDAVEENLTAQPPIPNLHITTRYDNIVLEALPEIRRWILEQGADYHARLRNYLSRYDRDLNPSLFDRPAGGKVAVGSFSLGSEPQVESKEDAK
jgi:hypothetical protein